MLAFVEVIVGVFGIHAGIDMIRRPKHHAEEARQSRAAVPRWRRWMLPWPSVIAYRVYGILAILIGVGMFVLALT